MKKYTAYIFWAYAVELLLTLIMYGLLLSHIGNAKAVSLICDHWATISKVAVAIVALSGAILLYYYQVLDSEFGKYLSWREADGRFLRVFQFQTVLPLLTLFASVSVSFTKNTLLSHLVWILFLYTCINGLTVIINIGRIVRLKQKFRFHYDILNSERTTE